MSPAQQNQHVRQLVGEAFQQLGAQSADGWRELILVRNNSYCGYCFDCGGLRAVWLFEHNRIEFYGPEARLIRTVSLADAEPRGMPCAA